MTWWLWLLVAVAATLLLYLGFIICLLVAGRWEDARALAGFIPDCAVLTARLLHDDRVRWRYKLLLLALLLYLAMPLDIVPDFIPVAGQLDDVVITAFVIRAFLKATGDAPIRDHWPGPQQSLDLVLRLAN